MKCVVVLLIATLAAVECKPRPQGIGLPDTSIPTGPNDSRAVRPDVAVGEDGALEVTETKNTKTENAEESSDHTSQEYEHTGANGSTVNQSSEKNSTHTKTEKEEQTESTAVKVGPQGGLTMTEDKSTTRDKTEENSETGRQTYKDSSGNDPNHQHTSESGSQYEKSNQTHDHHQETSHNQMSLTPDLETKSEHDETTSDQHEERQKEEGSAYARQEDYDKDNNKITDSRAESGSAYESEANTSTKNSTSKHEEKNSNGGPDENADNDENNTTINLEDAVGSQSETNIDTNVESETDAKRDTIVSEQSENEIDSNGGGEIDANNASVSDQSQNEMQIDSNAAGERYEYSEMGVEFKQDDETGNDTGSRLQTNMGHKFHVDEELYKELDRDERALGIVKDDPDSAESVEKTSDYSKIRNDFLLAVAQNIHNSRIVGDENGNARIVSPNQYSEVQSASGDFLNMDAPYRTLAQRYGASPVSSHYANAQIIESRFGNIPSIFNSGLTYDKSKTITNQYGEENDKYRKPQNKQNLFGKGSILENSILKLQLSPTEWEEKARKETEMKDSKLSSYKAKLAREGVKQDNIEPLVKNAILSQDLDDILGSAQTSAEINSAMKAFIGQEENDIPMSINMKNEINANNDNVPADLPDENEIFGYSKDTYLEKDDYDASKTSLDAFKDISQVITNQVDLVTPNDKFSAGIISENIMENVLDQPGFVSIGDVFEDKANNVVIDSFDNPRPQIISDNNSDKVTSLYETTGKSYVNSEIESNAMEYDGFDSSYGAEVDVVDKNDTYNSTENLGSIETKTEKKSINGNNNTKAISMTETTLYADNMNTVTESNFRSEILFQNDNQINNTSDKEFEVNSARIPNTQMALSDEETLNTSDTTETIISLEKNDQEEVMRPNVSLSQKTIKEDIDVSKYGQMNISNSNETLSESDSSLAEIPSLHNDSFIINNDTKVGEFQSENVDDAVIKEADSNFTTEKNDKVSPNITSEVSDLNEPTIEDTDVSTDNDSVIIDASDDISQSKTKVDSNSGDESYLTILDESIAEDTTAVNININNNMSTISSQKIISDVDSHSTFLIDNTTVVATSEDTENVSETIVSESNGDTEHSERLFNRSLLESDEEYLENTRTTKTNNDNNKNETANLNENYFKAELNSTTVENETEVSDNILNTTNTLNVDTSTSSYGEFAVIELTKNSENYRDYSTTEIVELNFQENASANKSDAKFVDVSNNSDISALDTSTELNINVEVANDSNRLEVTTIATIDVLNDLIVESNNTETNYNIPNADANTTIGPDNNKTPDTSTPKNKSDDLNIFTEETAKAEPNISFDHATEKAKDAGTANNTPITAVDYKSTTVINGVDQSTERTVGDIDKTGELEIKSDGPQTSVLSDQSDTEKSETLIATVESDKSETDQSVTSNSTVEPIKLETDKSETSNADIEFFKFDTDKFEKSITVESDEPKSDKSIELENNESEKSKAVEFDKSSVEPVKSEAIVKTDKFTEAVKAERENEESGSYVEDSTSKSDESSVSSERVFGIRSLRDYSGSGSAEK